MYYTYIYIYIQFSTCVSLGNILDVPFISQIKKKHHELPIPDGIKKTKNTYLSPFFMTSPFFLAPSRLPTSRIAVANRIDHRPHRAVAQLGGSRQAPCGAGAKAHLRQHPEGERRKKKKKMCVCIYV